MPNDPQDKKRILARMRKISGQCAGLERALETGSDCGAILQQIAAVRGAINGLMGEVLQAHIRDQFGAPEGEGGARTEELLTLVRSYLK
jgi:DNA-binding FrmR family transcriptional regulator